MSNNLFKIELNVTFPSRNYKGLLNKLKTFVSYCATVGIHQADGKKKVIRRYSTTSKKGKSVNHIAGKSHRMNVVKLAYQNEFGATINLKTKYKTTKFTRKIVINRKYARVTRLATRKYSEISDKQGYLLLDKQGKFVAYFKNQIKIPPRPFLTKILNEYDSKLDLAISYILIDTFVARKYTSSKAMHKIASLVKLKVQQNIRSVTPKASELTKKAKGFNQPLVDEKDRILKAIKYKVYSKLNIPDSKGRAMLKKQFEEVKKLDTLLKSAKVFDKIIEESNYTTKSFKYKGINPNYVSKTPLFEKQSANDLISTINSLNGNKLF